MCNYYQFLLTDSAVQKAIAASKTADKGIIRDFLNVPLGFGKVSEISCGNKHSWYLDRERKHIYCSGFNALGNAGVPVQKGEIFDNPFSVYRLDDDINSVKDETILEIHSAFSFNIVRTTHRLLFFGNNIHCQMNEALGKTWGLKFLFAHEINLKNVDSELEVSDIKRIKCQYDRTAIIFKNGRAFIYGGVTDFGEALPFIDSKFELPNFSINEIGLGIDYELISGYFDSDQAQDEPKE
jgi:hypothetical protein